MSDRRATIVLVPPDQALTPGDLVEQHRNALALDRQRTRPARGTDARTDIPDREPTRDRDMPATASPWG